MKRFGQSYLSEVRKGRPYYSLSSSLLLESGHEPSIEKYY